MVFQKGNKLGQKFKNLGKNLQLVCPNCNISFQRFESEIRGDKAYCSFSCAMKYFSRTYRGNKHHKYIRMKTKCEWCGITFSDIPYKIKTGRRFCSHSCANLAIGRTKIIPEGYTYNHRLARKIAMIFHGIKECGLCNTDTDLVVHHKDNDQTNNHPNNLEVLCRICHSRLHANGIIT